MILKWMVASIALLRLRESILKAFKSNRLYQTHKRLAFTGGGKHMGNITYIISHKNELQQIVRHAQWKLKTRSKFWC